MCLISVRHNITQQVQNEPGRLVFQKCVRNSQLQWGSIKKIESARGKTLSQKLQLLGVLQIDFTTISHKTLWRNQKINLKILFIFNITGDRKS